MSWVFCEALTHTKNICKALSGEIWNDLFEMVEDEAFLNGKLLVALRVEKAISKQLWKWLKLLTLPNDGWSYSLLLPCFLVSRLMGENAFLYFKG